MVYVFFSFLCVLTIFFSVYGRSQIAKCKSEEESRLVKAKWQLISGIFGAACVISAIAAVFLV